MFVRLLRESLLREKTASPPRMGTRSSSALRRKLLTGCCERVWIAVFYSRRRAFRVPSSSLIVGVEIAGRLDRSRGHKRNLLSGCEGSLPYGCVRSGSGRIKHRVYTAQPQTAPPGAAVRKGAA